MRDVLSYLYSSEHHSTITVNYIKKMSSLSDVFFIFMTYAFLMKFEALGEAYLVVR